MASILARTAPLDPFAVLLVKLTKKNEESEIRQFAQVFKLLVKPSLEFH